MDKEKPRLARLTTILTQLQSKRMLTARELSEKHGVSIRTIYRDIRTLEKSGVPIVTEEGKGYSLLEGYKLPPVMFTESEANALITAEQIINKNTDASFSRQYSNAIEKIRSILKYTQKDKVSLLQDRIYIRAQQEEDQQSDHLMNIQSAIVNYQLIHLTYHSLQNKESIRMVEPFALLHTQGNWLLIAFCRLRKSFRTFRLDCIKSLTLSSDHFEAHKISLQEYFEERKKEWDKTPDTPLT